MTMSEWFRNTEWNEEIEAHFDSKLRRARNKAQYLRIQASTLAASHPKVALSLLERYFQLGDGFDLAQAHVTSAESLMAMGQMDEALNALERALSREEVFPNLKTTAFTDYPFLVATKGVTSRYHSALRVLDSRMKDAIFPVDRFKWNASKAIILANLNDVSSAKHFAKSALSASVEAHSGFRHHPTVGLVIDRFAEVTRRLEKILSA